MKKIEGVVVYYDDGSRERLSAQQIMERFFGGFVQDPPQNTNGEGSPSLQTEPIVTEPEKQVANVDFVKETELVSENEPSVAEPEKNIETKPVGLPYEIKKDFVVTVDEKEYRSATMTRFPFGGPDLKGKSLLECVLWDRKFMERVAQNTKGKNADLAQKIKLVLARNPPTEDDA
tara:strand:+ start:18531 stop:19055 length:525 start_codon:yes stop_codon:yes gene_type:complete